MNAAVLAVSEAVQQAIDSCEITRGQRLQKIRFSKIWIAMAGYDRPQLVKEINQRLKALFSGTPEEHFRISTDIDLLPAQLSSSADLEKIIVLVSGTGSIAMSYEKKGSEWTRTARVGGWGHLLGDDGSGYAIGRDALRFALGELDIHRLHDTNDVPFKISGLTNAIVNHFQADAPNSTSFDLLSAILIRNIDSHQGRGQESQTASKIASVAKIVLGLRNDEDAKRITDNAAASVAQLIKLLTQGGNITSDKMGLVLSGGLMQHDEYRTDVIRNLAAKAVEVKRIEVVTDAAMQGALLLRSTK